jgi:hypothetical protein
MSTHRLSRISRDTAERILRRDLDALRQAGPLAGPLAAASTAAHRDDLVGEPAVMAAFEAAQLAPVPQSGRRSMLKATMAKVLTVKVAAILAGLSVGGVALAASTGLLPNPLSDTPPSHAPAATPSHPNGAGSADPNPSEYGLCQAFVAEATDNPGKALENPAFSALVSAAGGADNLSEYCDSVIAAGPGATRPSHPGANPTATGRPEGLPTPPTGAPATLPTPSHPTPSHPTTPSHGG